MNDTMRRNWLIGLTAVTALLFLYVGADAHGLTRLLAILGGVLILAAIAAAARSRPLAWLLLLAGALPVAVATWWSVVTPLLAALALLFGWMVTPKTTRLAANRHGPRQSRMTGLGTLHHHVHVQEPAAAELIFGRDCRMATGSSPLCVSSPSTSPSTVRS